MTKLVDCVCFLNENELFELRYNELYNVVDRFVVVESDTTGSGIKKPYNFQHAELDKVVYIKAAQHKLLSGNYEARHDLMYGQREFFKQGLDGIEDSDYILTSDLDEIPRKDILVGLKQRSDLAAYITLVLRGSFYYINTRFMSPENHVWFPCPILSEKYAFINTDLKWLRNNKDYFPRVENAGWHISHTSPTIDILREKMLASSHTEYSGDKFTSVENITRRRNNLIDPYDRGYIIERVPIIAGDYPQYFLDNIDKFLWMVRG